MESFQLYEKIYLSRNLAAAYEDACRKLGIIWAPIRYGPIVLKNPVEEAAEQ